MKPSTRRRLDAAIEERRVVRVHRKPRFADRLDGVVLRVGRRWALMAKVVDGGYFDGVTAFRLKDIVRVDEDASVAAVFARTRPEWPPTFDGEIDLDDIARLLEDIAPTDVLRGIQKERERSGLWVGLLDQVTRRYVYLHEVRPDASWRATPLGYRLKAITSVDIGSRYLASISAIALPLRDASDG